MAHIHAIPVRVCAGCNSRGWRWQQQLRLSGGNKQSRLRTYARELSVCARMASVTATADGSRRKKDVTCAGPLPVTEGLCSLGAFFVATVSVTVITVTMMLMIAMEGG